MSRQWAQVNARGDVSPTSAGAAIAAGARDGFRIKTTASQSVNGGANVVWHDDSASSCFNVGGFWASGTPEVAVLPVATEDVEWYIFTLYLRVIPGESVAFFPNNPRGANFEAGIFTDSKVFHCSGLFFVTPASTLTERTMSVQMGTEYAPPFTIEGENFWSIMRLR